MRRKSSIPKVIFQIVKVCIEKPVDYGFKSATCWLPDYCWEKVEGYTEEEISSLGKLIHNLAATIYESVRDVGFEHVSAEQEKRMTYKLEPMLEKITSPTILVFPDGTTSDYLNGKSIVNQTFSEKYFVTSIQAADHTIRINLKLAEPPDNTAVSYF